MALPEYRAKTERKERFPLGKGRVQGTAAGQGTYRAGDLATHDAGGVEDERRGLLLLFFCTLVTGPRRSLSLKLSDTRVYEPQIRGLLDVGVVVGIRSMNPPPRKFVTSL